MSVTKKTRKISKKSVELIDYNIQPDLTSGIFGNVDAFTPQGISGWVIDLSQPTMQLNVSAYIADKFVASGVTNLARPDISDLLQSSTQCGFLLKWDALALIESIEELAESDFCPIEVKVEGEGYKKFINVSNIPTIPEIKKCVEILSNDAGVDKKKVIKRQRKGIENSEINITAIRERKNKLLRFLDISWLRNRYFFDNEHLSDESIVENYFIGVKKNKYSPNEDFDEKSYLEDHPDVLDCVNTDYFICGYDHYLTIGFKESRITRTVLEGDKSESYKRMMLLEQRIPGITQPTGLYNIDNFRRNIIGHPKFNFCYKSEKTLAVLIPHLDPDILFGGYRAFFEFIKQVQNKGVKTSFFISELSSYKNIFELLSDLEEKAPDIYEIVNKHSIPKFLTKTNNFSIGTQDRIIVYSASTARIANAICSNKQPFYFFIQEFEPIFQTHGCSGFLTAEPFYFDSYIPIFNSTILKNYFIQNKIGGRWIVNEKYFWFEHAIKKTPVNKKILSDRLTKNFILYARPESHAERNLFEVAILALERAIEQDVFSDNWTFTGIGTLGTYTTIHLPKGYTLDLIPKLPGDNYYKTLQNFDVGMSLIFAPHPGVVHFEFARAAIPTVTNVYLTRDEVTLKAISNNIIPALPTIDGLVAGLKDAVALSHDIDQRIENANNMTMPSNWEESYDELITKFIKDL